MANNQQLLLKAIGTYPKISTSQKYLLKILVDSDTSLNTKDVIKITQLKKQWVYLNLKKLCEAKILYKDNKRGSILYLNQEMVEELIYFYEKNQAREKSIRNNTMSNLKNNISMYLEEMNISISAFEKKAQLGSAALNRILDGKTKNPATQTLIKISKTIGCSLDELFNQIYQVPNPRQKRKSQNNN